MDNAASLRESLLWLAPLARLAAVVTAALVVSRAARDEDQVLDVLALIASLV